MSEQMRRFSVVTTWNDDCTEKIGSHIEESTDGIYMLVADHDTLRQAARRVFNVESGTFERGAAMRLLRELVEEA